MKKLKIWLAGLAFVVASVGGAVATQIATAPPAQAHQGWCNSHYTQIAGPGTYFHTTGLFGTGAYDDYKITIVSRRIVGPGYVTYSPVYSFRTKCR